MTAVAWVRSAFWMGAPKAEAADRFAALLENEVAPRLRKLPGVQNAHVLWPQRCEDNPPRLACQVMVEFESREDLERMLASPERRELRPKVLELVAMFDGNLSHIDYQVGR